MQDGAITPGSSVVVIDDLIATGMANSDSCVCELICLCGLRWFCKGCG